MRKLRPLLVLLLIALLAPLAVQRSTVAQDDGIIDRLYGGDFGGGSNPQTNFNPFVPATRLSAFGLIYEPLVIVNAYNCEVVPWLATDAGQWPDPQTLTFTVREGVTWSDGSAFTADDVAFTFNLLKQTPALDERGVIQYVSEVTAAHPTVTFKFTEPAAWLYTRLVEVVIVPRHIWSEVGDPLTFTNEDPVGTGPFMLKSFNGQELVVERNPTYWQADKIRVQELVFTKAAEGQVNQLRLAEGAYDWNAMFVPDIENTYVAKDPEHNKYWFPQGGVISLYLNLTMAPFDDVEFRRGIAHAIDREEIRQKAQFGYVDVATQVGLNLPGHQAYLDPSIPDQGFIPYDPAKALEILTAAGYTREGDGPLMGKDGEPIEFTFNVQSGWNDWVQAAEIIREDLAAIGITMDVQAGTPDIVIADRASGNYEATFGVQGGSCNMYTNFADPLDSARTKPVGEEALSNYVRWQDPETDALLAQLRGAPDAATQTPILHQLQQIMYNELPMIPLWYGGIWFQYRTEHAVGWPSAEDPYAHPSNLLLILTHLEPAPE